MGSQSIEKTGLIYLSTVPSGATVYISNKKFPEKTPTIIRNLYPANYHIKISLPYHETWDKFLPVQEEKATAAEHILLIPQHWRTERFTKDAFENLISIDNQPFMLLGKSTGIKDQFIYQQEGNDYKILYGRPEDAILNNRLVEFGKLNAALSDMIIKKIYSVPDSPFLLFEGVDQGRMFFLWANLKTNPATVQDLTELFPAPPQDILWAASEGKILYAIIDGIVHILDLDTKTVSSIPDDKAESFAFANNRLYVLTKDNLLKRYDAKGKNAETLLNVPEIRHSLLFWKRQQLKIAVLDDKLILFLSNESTLLYNQLQYISINKNIKGFSYSNSIEKLLLWTDNDIGFVDFTKNDQSSLFKVKSSLTWLGARTSNIKKAFWINNGNQILFHTSNAAFLTDTETFNQTRVIKVVSIKNGTSIGYAQKTGILYYLDYKSHELFATAIIPQREIFPHYYPEDISTNTKKSETSNEI